MSEPVSEPTQNFDPDLRLWIDGRTVRPDSCDNHTYTFALAGGVSAVRIISRTTVPAEHDPAASDQRRLGVALLSLSLRSPHVELRLHANDPALVHGFYPAEAAHRWTDGDAEIPPDLFAMFDEAFTLEVRLAGAALAYGDAAADGPSAL